MQSYQGREYWKSPTFNLYHRMHTSTSRKYRLITQIVTTPSPPDAETLNTAGIHSISKLYKVYFK